jgi:hypothetical protein
MRCLYWGVRGGVQTCRTALLNSLQCFARTFQDYRILQSPSSEFFNFPLDPLRAFQLILSGTSTRKAAFARKQRQKPKEQAVDESTVEH